MPTLQDSDIIDLGITTLKELGRLRFNQIATKIQRYEIMSRLLKKDKLTFQNGNGIQRSIVIQDSGAAKNVGLHATDDVNIGDVMKTINIPWRHTTTNYGWERREILVNNGASRIVDIMKVRRADAMISLAALMETDFWSKPADSTDKLKVFGVPYWVVKNATAGFNGGDPSGFTGGAGSLTVATAPRWNNYTAPYVAISKADLITAMRRAYRLIQFVAPIDIPDYRRGNGATYRMYCNIDTITGIETLGEQQNENLGRDIASMDGKLTFRGNPIIWIPQLDTDTTDPLYMLNFDKFGPVCLTGDYMRETDPKVVANQHNDFVVHIDLTWNLLCDDRRCQAVISK